MNFSEPHSDLFARHPRSFAENLYVYPVLSRRAGGISIGVNLSRDKHCNFDCVYCQVDRREPGDATEVDLQRLREELDATIALVTSGELYEDAAFHGVPEALRRLNDIALSGDGEPTLSAAFPAAVEIACEARRRHGLNDVKLVLITNATLLDQPRLQGALQMLDANNGQIWAKLDAGGEGGYRQVSRSAVPWTRILTNLRQAAVTRPIVIQSLFLRLGERTPAAEEIDAYCDRLQEILAGGGQIKLVQVHTIARQPADRSAAALSNAELDAIAQKVRSRTGLEVAVYYGATSPFAPRK